MNIITAVATTLGADRTDLTPFSEVTDPDEPNHSTEYRLAASISKTLDICYSLLLQIAVIACCHRLLL